MDNTAQQLELDVDRGPNWLFVKLHPSDESPVDAPHMADELWSISSRHFIYRLVLELDEFQSLPEGMMGQIVMLNERLNQHGGSLKLCGLSDECQDTLHQCHLDKALPNHASRETALLGEAVA